jgi:hypothetical protein
MMKLENRRAKSWCKCSYCGEQIRTAETFRQVTSNGKEVRGEKYCDSTACIAAAHENNPELNDDSENESDGEEHLRRMEDYAEYQYNGNTSAYWTDRDAGYAN